MGVCVWWGGKTYKAHTVGGLATDTQSHTQGKGRNRCIGQMKGEGEAR